MNKFAQNIHAKFVSGEIDGLVFNFMSKFASSLQNTEDAILFDEHIRNLTQLKVSSEQDCNAYFNIYANLSKYGNELISDKKLLNQLCVYAFINKNQYSLTKQGQYFKVILDFINENKDLIKNSHPNNAGIESSMDIEQPFDLNKWIETMRYIYDMANTNNLPLDDVSNQVVANWPEKEAIHFKRWMKYYQEGNYDKYNVKTAQYFINKSQEGDVPNVKDMFDTSAFAKPDPAVEKKKRLDEARRKLRSRLKSVVELLDKYRDVLPQSACNDMLKDVDDLHKKVWILELKASLVDSIIRTSNQFNKYGFVEGADELKKIAQEVATDKLPEPPVAPKQVPMEKGAPIPEPIETKEPAVEKPSENVDHIRVPEVNIGEEQIEIPDFSSATHRDALAKLEEINKVISERNVVRALAAVDIILGQLGIASYFPQLSEAQSKLMDAFNYAGTRVAETIGQMRGGGQGIPVEGKKPKQDVVEVTDEVEKPVGEVISGGPQQPLPPAKV